VFSGIVTGVGKVASLELGRGGARLRVIAPRRYARFRRGESVSVSGVCLTAVRAGRDLVADLSPETLRRSHLGRLAPGDRVNLERALRWGDRLSGHFVLGHVDGIARVRSIVAAGNSWLFRFSIPPGLSRYVARKGSVALDGISLTVAARRGRAFDVAVIPVTFRRTTLGRARRGDGVNFEVDIFARYGRAGASRRVMARRKRR
jgi:riboflavin synthase